jgi:tartrate dehydrogenase/decarboxylase/D-malate dehydrogenase
MAATAHRIAVLPGDGIGREVVPAAQEVLERVGETHDVRFDWDELPWGCTYY